MRKLAALLCAGLIVGALFLLGDHLPRMLTDFAGMAPRPLEDVLSDLDRYYGQDLPPPPVDEETPTDAR